MSDEELVAELREHQDGSFSVGINGWPALKLAADRIEALNAEIKRLHSDREYVIGWVDGFEHALSETINLKFPTMLRKMWSGGEVQKWLDDAIADAKAARSALKDTEA